MRIQELLENTNFKDSDFVKHQDGKRDIDYDLSEDLAFYMHNDDDVYRRHTYPAISKCIESIKSNKKINPGIFKAAVEESYKSYVKKFPIRELTDNISDDVCKEICNKLHEELCQHYEEGKYKD
jgi:hypothetical protein